MTTAKKSAKENPNTDTALAALLGVTPGTVSKWRRLPGAPESRNLEEWRNFVLEAGLGVAPTKLSPRREALLCRRLEIAIERDQFALNKERGAYVEMTKLDAEVLRVALSMRQILVTAMEHELPPRLEGLDCANMRPIMREVLDRIIDCLRDLRAFTPKDVQVSPAAEKADMAPTTTPAAVAELTPCPR